MAIAVHPGSAAKRWLPSQLADVAWDLWARRGVQTDGAAKFVASDKSWLSGSALLSNTTSFSLSFWVRPDDLAAIYQCVNLRGGSIDGVRILTDGSVQTRVRTATEFSTSSSSAAVISAGTWHNLVWIWNRDDAPRKSLLYVDGVLVATGNQIAETAVNSETFELGRHKADGHYLNGRMDSACVAVATAFTNSEIAYLYNSGSGRILSELGQAGTDGAALKHTSNGGKITSGPNFDELSGTRFDYFGSNDLTEQFVTLVTNGSFASDANWTKGTGWTISGGTASCDGTQTSDSDLTQAITLVDGSDYAVTYTVSGLTAGTITPVVGGTAGTARSANGTYTETITASSTDELSLRADADFTGSVDDVSLKATAIKLAVGIASGAAVAGDTITTCSDQSGEANDVRQSTVAKRFVYSSVSDKWEIVADGTDDYLTGTTAAVYKPATFGARIKPTNFSSTKTLIGSDTANGLVLKINTSGQLVLSQQGGSVIATSTGTLTAGEWATVVVRYNSGGTYSFRINGADAGSGLSSETIASGKPLLGSLDGTSEFFGGSIRAAVAVTASVADGVAVAIEEHLERT